MVAALKAVFEEFDFSSAALPVGFLESAMSDSDLRRSLIEHRKKVRDAFADWRRQLFDAYEQIAVLTENQRPAPGDAAAAEKFLHEVRLGVRSADAVVSQFDRNLSAVAAQNQIELQAVKTLRPSLYEAARRAWTEARSLADAMHDDLVDIYYRMLELEAEYDPDSRERTAVGSTEGLLAHLRTMS